MAFFITGTDTNVGKTLFSMGFMLKYAKKYNYSYIKPFQSGDKDENDTEKVKDLIERKIKISDPIYTFTYPASPYYAATLEKAHIDIEKIDKYLEENQNNRLIIEGAGGILVPITEKILYIDIIKKFNIPVILICKTTLGTINHTLLTIEALRNRNLKIVGFYAFGKKDALGLDNLIFLERYSGVKNLGSMELPEEENQSSLRDYLNDFFSLSEDFLHTLE